MSHVVILGAGLGARLRPLTDDRPKCVVEIAGEPLARRMLRQFAERGATHATVVIGHFAPRAAELIGTQVGEMQVSFIENTDYSTTNTMYSTLLAIDALRDGGYLVEGDIVAHNRVIEKLLGADVGASHWAVDAWTPAHTGSRLWTNSEARIVKQDIHRHTGAREPRTWKSAGMLKLTPHAARVLGQCLRDEPNRNIYYDDVIGKNLDRFEIDVLDLGGSPWVEIDDLNDMSQARQLFEDKP